MRAQDQVQTLLRICATSEDDTVRHEAIRAQASLADISAIFFFQKMSMILRVVTNIYR